MVIDKQLLLVKVDKNYCNFLRKFDEKVPYNFNDKETRPYIGILFKIDSLMYFAPLSSPKLKHLSLKSKLDFLKIDGGNLGVINFNNMIPVSRKNITLIDLNNDNSSILDTKYLNLLKKQIMWLNRNSGKIYSRAEKLYEKYNRNLLNESIRIRCCDFKLLEEKCIEYNKNFQAHTY
ncbi:MAG: type III toxin-antitoxin system ToxN/AbiQ family toxin [Bacilli bacterium]|nr:type III toxin-antitoxin system ToxN/AbiQ family toxin [Bacilli bacterium]